MSESESKKDDRNHHRIPIQLLVDFQSDGNYLFDFCEDLGTGGLFIQTQAPLPEGSKIDLTFTLPDSKKTISTSGKVIWVQESSAETNKKAGMGVQFDKFDTGERKELQDFIIRHSENENEKKKPA